MTISFIYMHLFFYLIDSVTFTVILHLVWHMLRDNKKSFEVRLLRSVQKVTCKSHHVWGRWYIRRTGLCAYGGSCVQANYHHFQGCSRLKLSRRRCSFKLSNTTIIRDQYRNIRDIRSVANCCVVNIADDDFERISASQLSARDPLFVNGVQQRLLICVSTEARKFMSANGEFMSEVALYKMPLNITLQSELRCWWQRQN